MAVTGGYELHEVKGMGILGIDNRTENWKTARCFAPFFGDVAARLKLAKRLGVLGEPPPSEIKLELFWKGLRDHLKQNRDSIKSIEEYYSPLASHYQKLFSDLPERI